MLSFLDPRSQEKSQLGGLVLVYPAEQLAAFAQFASDLDEATRKQLDRGRMFTELMKQAQYAPLSVSNMAITLLAANNGYLDDVPTEKVLSFESALHGFMSSKYKKVMEEGFKLQSINRSDSDEKYLEADNILKEIEKLKA